MNVVSMNPCFRQCYQTSKDEVWNDNCSQDGFNLTLIVKRTFLIKQITRNEIKGYERIGDV